MPACVKALPGNGRVDQAVVHRISVFPLGAFRRGRRGSAYGGADTARPVVVALELTGGTVGYGEALPKSEVDGETAGAIVEAITTVFSAFLVSFHPHSFPAALEAIET